MCDISRFHWLLCGLLLFCFSSSIMAQVPDLRLDESILLQIVEDNARDEAQFWAQLDLITAKAQTYPRTLDELRPMVAELHELGQELGRPFEQAAYLGDQLMFAIVCPNLTRVQRDSGSYYYHYILDAIGEPQNAQESGILAKAAHNMFTYCHAPWYEPEDSTELAFIAAEALPFMSDSALIVAKIYTGVWHHIAGHTTEGNITIREALRLAETTAGAYEPKYRLYTLLADFYNQFSGDQQRVLEMFDLAAEAMEHISDDFGLSRHVIEMGRFRSLIELEEYDSARLKLDDVYEELKSTEGNHKVDAAATHLYVIGEYMGLNRKADDSTGLHYITEGDSIIAVMGDELNVYQTSSFYGHAAMYKEFVGEKRAAVPYFETYFEQMKGTRFNNLKLNTECLAVMASLMQDLGDNERSLEFYARALRMEQRMHSSDARTGSAQAAFALDVSENNLARERAEQETLLAQTEAAADRKLYSLLAIGGLLLGAILAFFYFRARRDQRIIAEQKEVVEGSLAEKDVLLREIHHRVKNNLQIISGLLAKQARISKDPKLQQLVTEGQERIQSMALIHQNLYQSDRLSGVNVKSYLGELSENIIRSQDGQSIELDLQVADEHLDIDTAIPIGLILNELLTNAYKYAFPGDSKGKVLVEFKQQAGKYFLQVSDDGVGLPQEQDLSKSNTLGVNLVNGLVRQLEGEIKWGAEEVAGGTQVTIEFAPNKAMAA